VPDTVKVLFIGDIIGQPGSRAVFFHHQNLKKKFGVDVSIANAENAANGFGITPEIAHQLFSCGIDVLTSGNHIWQKREINSMLESDTKLLRPANYPSSVPGKGYCTVTVKGVNIGVINLQGRLRMYSINCPFRQAMDIIRAEKKDTKIFIVDFHAEAPDEKEALGLYLDGKVSLLVGTHTHVQTADERIFSGGTGYITDVGMTGPDNSVIGFNPSVAIERNLTQMPLKMEVSDDSASIRGVVAEIESDSGRCLSIHRISENTRT
jgi:hypothetical protein